MTRRRIKAASRAPTEVDKLVGARIRKLRLDRNMTLAELGHDLSISHQQLQKYETGTNRLSAGMLHAVVAALRVDIPDLFEGVGESTPADDPVRRGRAACHSLIDRIEDAAQLSGIRRVIHALVAA